MKFKPQNIGIKKFLVVNKVSSLFTCCCLVRFWSFESNY